MGNVGTGLENIAKIRRLPSRMRGFDSLSSAPNFLDCYLIFLVFAAEDYELAIAPGATGRSFGKAEAQRLPVRRAESLRQIEAKKAMSPALQPRDGSSTISAGATIDRPQARHLA